MTGWRLAWKGGGGGPPLDARPLLPERLTGCTETDLGAIEFAHGNRLTRLGELFAIRPGADGRLVIEGATSRFRGLGAGMTGGRLVIEGDAGDGLAQGMAGGEISVDGAAGSFAGTGITGGVVCVAGDVGDFAGAALPGGRFGMAGGWFLVGGKLGARAGDRMRRGVIAVAGGLGDFAGARMIGGTIVAGGAVGIGTGYAMRRGTLVLAQAPSHLLATFADGGVHELFWLRLLEAELARLGVPRPALGPTRRRLTGCASAAGLGELLVAAG